MEGEIQKRIFNIFKIVSDICENNGLRYFAIGGTCLGAVRHGGFIPWDDDLDIAMPLDDFKKFIELAPKLLPDYLELFTPITAKHDYLNYIKVMDNRTMMTEDTFFNWRDTYEGVWIDIMPLSGVPSGVKKQNRFARKIKNHIRLCQKTKLKYPIEGLLLSKISWLIVYPFRILPYDFLWRKYLKYLGKYPFDTSDYTGYVWSREINKLIFPQKWFNDFVYFNFESTKIRCPVGYHGFLSQMFGNYMEYPPVEQRKTGHHFDNGVIDLQHSYKDYQSGKFHMQKSTDISKGKQGDIN